MHTFDNTTLHSIRHLERRSGACATRRYAVTFARRGHRDYSDSRSATSELLAALLQNSCYLIEAGTTPRHGTKASRPHGRCTAASQIHIVASEAADAGVLHKLHYDFKTNFYGSHTNFLSRRILFFERIQK
jgi:hypothetical protein